MLGRPSRNSAQPFVARLPFTIAPKKPLEVANTDKITIPVAVSNSTDKDRSVELEAVLVQNLAVVGDRKQSFPVAANKNARRLFSFTPNVARGEAKLLFQGQCNPFGTDSGKGAVS